MPIGQGRLLEPPQLVTERSNILRSGAFSTNPSEPWGHLSEVLQAEVPLGRGKAFQLPGAPGRLHVRALLHKNLLHDALPRKTLGASLLREEGLSVFSEAIHLLPREQLRGLHYRAPAAHQVMGVSLGLLHKH